MSLKHLYFSAIKTHECNRTIVFVECQKNVNKICVTYLRSQYPNDKYRNNIFINNL